MREKTFKIIYYSFLSISFFVLLFFISEPRVEINPSHPGVIMATLVVIGTIQLIYLIILDYYEEHNGWRWE